MYRLTLEGLNEALKALLAQELNGGRRWNRTPSLAAWCFIAVLCGRNKMILQRRMKIRHKMRRQK